MTDTCAGCHLAVEGGTEACQALFDRMTLRVMSDARYARVHRLAVDAYTLQHPDRYCRSAKSLAAHLTGMCCGLEHGGSEATYAALQQWLNGRSPVEKSRIPAFRGATTLADALAAEDPVAHARAVEEWARSTWEAYAPLHALARRWIAEALGQAPRRSAAR
ncbi:MAG: DUF5946 family protein [Chloroflexota bacterium]|nr:DUF5946 family protein [Chloroflexota bacterium]